MLGMVFLLIFVGMLFLSSPFRGFVFWLARPLWKAENVLVSYFDASFKILQSKRNLVEENRALLIENNKLNYYILANDYLRRENDNLREAVGRHKETGSAILAYVLVKPGQTPYDQLIIDAGTSLGIAVGDLVAVEGSVVIGEVTEVFYDSAKVELYSTPNKSLLVLIGPNSIQANALGVGAGNFRVKLPKETDIKEGDSIVIPSISSNVFGVVEKIDTAEANTFQNIYFKNPVNLNEIKTVLILKSKKK